MEGRWLLSAFPSVTGITRSLPVGPITAASALTFSVQFNESVTGVDASDFRAVTGGAASVGGAISVAGGGANYTVTLNGVHGSGTVGLNLVDNGSIHDAANATLGSVGSPNGSFEGQRYTVLQAGPQVASINRAGGVGPTASGSSVQFSVTFDKPVTGVDATDFSLALSGVSASLGTVTGSGAIYTVNVTGVSGVGTVGLNLVDNGTIRDLAGNPLQTGVASFQGQTGLTAGTRPYDVIATDVNNDGRADIVSADTIGNTVSVWLDNGNGTFTARTTYATLGAPRVEAADVNGDGKPDLLLADSNTLGILIGNGDGTFVAEYTIAATQPNSIAVADLNGDGKVDVVLTYPGAFSPSVQVFIGNGNGNFAGPTSYAMPTSQVMVKVADVDNDGRLDIVAVGGGTATFLKGSGTGTFQSGVTFGFAAATGLPAIAVADINGDGKPDLIASNGNNYDFADLFLGNGNGTFGPLQTFTAGNAIRSITVSDVNGDGRPDLVLGRLTTQSTGVSVVLGNGNGTFKAPQVFATSPYEQTAAVADFNGDGRPDVVGANYSGQSLSVLLNNGQAGFIGQTYTVTGGTTPAHAVVAAADPVVWAEQVTGPLAPRPGHSFFVSKLTSSNTAAGQWWNASAVTPNTTNDLVMNVSPFATNYTPCCEGATGSMALLTNGITQTQIAGAPGAGQPAVGDGGANDASNSANVVSTGVPYNASYNLGTAGGAAASATGYDLSEIDVITGHQDYRSAVNPVDILVRPVGSNRFVSLSNGRGFTFGGVPDGNGGFVSTGVGGAAQMALVSDVNGQPLARNISAVQFVMFGTQTYSFFRELVVTGTASGAAAAAPAAPTGVAAAWYASGGGATMWWNPVANATGYSVLRANAVGGPYTAVGGVTSQTWFTDATALPQKTYFYEVVAVGHGDSAAGGPVTLVTGTTSAAPAVSAMAAMVPPDPVMWANTFTGPLAPMPGHSFFAAGNPQTGPAGVGNANNSAITPNTTNDLVLNVTPYAQTYTPASEGANAAPGNTGSVNAARLLTNGITQNQVGPFPSSGAVAAVGSTSANDISSGANVVSNSGTQGYWMAYNLGAAPGVVANGAGYDITEIDVITGHLDSRVGMQVDILIENVGSDQFYSLSNNQLFTFSLAPNGTGNLAQVVLNKGSAQMALVGLAPGQPIATNVKAVKFVASNQQAWFRELVVTGTPAAISATPATPANVTATPGAGPTIAWDPSPSASAYLVTRSGSLAGPYASLAQVPGSQTSYLDRTAGSLTTYYYKVTALAGGASAPSGEASLTTGAYGATATLFQNQGWAGPAGLTETIPFVDYNGGPNSTAFPIAPLSAAGFSSFIQGRVTTELGGTYLFGANTDDDGYLFVNGQLVSHYTGGHAQGLGFASLPITLQAQTTYDFVLLQDNRGSPWGFQMVWREPMSSAPPGDFVPVPGNLLTPAPTQAAAPASVTATVLSGTGVRVAWPSTPDVSSFAYVIQRAPSDSNGNAIGAFAQVGQIFSGPAALGALPFARWGPVKSSFDDATAQPNSKYVYRVGVLMAGQPGATFGPTSAVVTTSSRPAAVLSGGVLTVTLAGYDTANVSVDGGGNLVVADGAGTIFSAPASSVSGLNVTGPGGGNPATLNFTSAVTISGAVSATGLTAVNVNGALAAGQVSFASSSNIAVNANITTTGPLTLTADSDNDGFGTLTTAANATLASGGGTMTLHGAGITVAGPVNSGAGNIDFTLSGAAVFSTAGVASSGTITVNDLNSTSVTYNATWAQATGTVVYNFPQAAFFVSTGINTSAGNAALQITAASITVNGAINTGTGTLTLQSSAVTVNASVTAGLVTVPATQTMTLNAPLTAGGGMSVAGIVNVRSTTLTVSNGLTLSGASSRVNLNSTATTPASLAMANTQTIGGSGKVVFNGTPATVTGYVRVGVGGNAATLTIGSAASVVTGTGSGVIGSGTPGSLITNQGTIAAQSAGTSITLVDTEQNSGAGAVLAGAVNTINSASWTGAGDGASWTDPANWSTNQVPGPATDVTISSGGGPTVTIGSGVQSIHSLNTSKPVVITGELDVAAPSTATSITLAASGTLAANNSFTIGTLTMQDYCVLTGSGLVTVTGGLTWYAGTMSGTGTTTVNAAATLTISGELGVGPTGTLGATLARTFNTYSTVASWSGNIYIAYVNGTFNNYGTFNGTPDLNQSLVSTGLTGSNNTTSAFNNFGTLTVGGNFGWLWFNTGNGGVSFNNSGTATFTNGGTLLLDKGGTNSGTITAAAGGAVDLRGTTTFTATGTLGGPGTISFDGGTYTFPNSQANPTAFNPTGPLNLNAGTITINNAINPSSLGNIGAVVTLNGSLNNANAATITASGNLTLNGGSWSPASLSNAGTLNVLLGANVSMAGALSGGGSVTVGGSGPGGASTLTVGSFQQNVVTINSPATMSIAANTNPVANTANRLVETAGASLVQIPTATLTIPNTTTALTLAGGRLAGGALAASTAVLFTSSPGTFDGVTLNSGLNVSGVALTVLNGLTLANNAILTLTSTSAVPASLGFVGSQTLGGTGQVQFNGSPPATVGLLPIGSGATPATLTIGAGVTVRTGTGSGVIGSAIPGSQILNQGTISAQTLNATLIVLDALQNQGTGTSVQSNGGVLITPDIWTGAGDGASWTDPANWSANALPNATNVAEINLASNPTVTLGSGTQSVYYLLAANALRVTGGTLVVSNRAQVGNLTLAGGTLKGGTYLALAGAATPMAVTQSSTLDAVTLGLPLTIGATGVVHVVNGLTVNSTLSLRGNFNGVGPAVLEFDGSQTLGGTGTITFDGDAPQTSSTIAVGQAPNAATLTVAAGLTIATGNASGIIGSGISGNQILNQGTIAARTASTSITVLDPLTNSGAGTSSQSNGGQLNLNTGGTLNVVGGSINLPSTIGDVVALNVTGGSVSFVGNNSLNVTTLNVSGGTVTAAAPVVVTSTAVLSGGTITGAGGVTINPGVTATVTGDVLSTAPLVNNGTITIASGTLELDGGGTQPGNFTVGAGAALTFGGGATLTLDAGSTVSGAGVVEFTGAAVVTVTGSYDVGSTVVLGGAQVVLPDGSSTGTLTVLGGNLSIGPAGAGGGVRPAASGTNTVVAGQIVMDGGTTSVAAGWTLSVLGPTLFGGAATIAVASDAATPGVLLLGGDVTFAGGAGTASISSAGSGSKRGVVDLGGVTRSFTANDGSAAVDLSVSAQLSHGGLRSAGGGWVQLVAANVYAGGTTLAGGTLEADDPASLGTGPVTFGGGNFAPRGGGGSSFTLPGPLTALPANSITIDVGTGTVIAPGATLGTALNVLGGAGGRLLINGPLVLQADLSVNDALADVEVSGAISASGGSWGILKTLGGTLTLDGSAANTYGGLTSVFGGTLVLAKPAGVLTVPGNLTVNGPATVRWGNAGQLQSSATVHLNAVPGPAVLDLNGQSQALASLTLTGGGTVIGGSLSVAGPVTGSGTLNVGGVAGSPAASLSTPSFNVGGVAVDATGSILLPANAAAPTTSAANAVTVQPGGVLDLGNNALLISYGSPGADPLALIRSYLSAGYDNGKWDGVGGIRSAAARLNPAGDTSIGWADWSDGTGVNPTANSILLRYAVVGDTDLDGTVGLSDYTAVVRNFATGTRWDQGAVTYAASVNLNDYTAVVRNFGKSALVPAAPAAQAAGASGTTASTPSSSTSSSPSSLESKPASAGQVVTLVSSVVKTAPAGKHQSSKVKGRHR